MPNYIAYSNSEKGDSASRTLPKVIRPSVTAFGQGDSAKCSRIQSRVLGQVLLHSAKCTRPKYSRIQPRVLGQSSFSQGFSVEGHSAKVAREGHSAKVTRPKRSRERPFGFGYTTRTRPFQDDSPPHSDSATPLGLGQTTRTRPDHSGSATPFGLGHSRMTRPSYSDSAIAFGC